MIRKTIRAATVDTLHALIWQETAKQEELGFAPVMETLGRDKFGFVANLEFAKEHSNEAPTD